MIELNAKSDSTVEVVNGSFPLGEKDTIKLTIEDPVINENSDVIYTGACEDENNFCTYGKFDDNKALEEIETENGTVSIQKVKDFNGNTTEVLVFTGVQPTELKDAVMPEPPVVTPPETNNVVLKSNSFKQMSFADYDFAPPTEETSTVQVETDDIPVSYNNTVLSVTPVKAAAKAAVVSEDLTEETANYSYILNGLRYYSNDLNEIFSKQDYYNTLSEIDVLKDVEVEFDTRLNNAYKVYNSNQDYNLVINGNGHTLRFTQTKTVYNTDNYIISIFVGGSFHKLIKTKIEICVNNLNFDINFIRNSSFNDSDSFMCIATQSFADIKIILDSCNIDFKNTVWTNSSGISSRCYGSIFTCQGSYAYNESITLNKKTEINLNNTNITTSEIPCILQSDCYDYKSDEFGAYIYFNIDNKSSINMTTKNDKLDRLSLIGYKKSNNRNEQNRTTFIYVNSLTNLNDSILNCLYTSYAEYTNSLCFVQIEQPNKHIDTENILYVKSRLVSDGYSISKMFFSLTKPVFSLITSEGYLYNHMYQDSFNNPDFLINDSDIKLYDDITTSFEINNKQTLDLNGFTIRNSETQDTNTITISNPGSLDIIGNGQVFNTNEDKYAIVNNNGLFAVNSYLMEKDKYEIINANVDEVPPKNSVTFEIQETDELKIEPDTEYVFSCYVKLPQMSYESESNTITISASDAYYKQPYFDSISENFSTDEKAKLIRIQFKTPIQQYKVEDENDTSSIVERKLRSFKVTFTLDKIGVVYFDNMTLCKLEDEINFINNMKLNFVMINPVTEPITKFGNVISWSVDEKTGNKQALVEFPVITNIDFSGNIALKLNVFNQKTDLLNVVEDFYGNKYYPGIPEKIYESDPFVLNGELPGCVCDSCTI